MDLYTYNASVLRIIDGDTLEVVVDVGFRMATRLPLRLAHVDAPEHNTKRGQDAIAFVAGWLGPLPAAVQVHTYKPADKYGRYLADVLLAGSSLADALLTAGLAVPYEGGTKA